MAEARKTLTLELDRWKGKELATGLYAYNPGLPS